MRHIILGLILSLSPQASAENTDDTARWTVRMMRIEGAAAGVRRAAESVEVSSKKISNNGYLRNLTQLKTELNKLNRMVISARLAVDVAKEASNPPE